MAASQWGGVQLFLLPGVHNPWQILQFSDLLLPRGSTFSQDLPSVVVSQRKTYLSPKGETRETESLPSLSTIGSWIAA